MSKPSNKEHWAGSTGVKREIPKTQNDNSYYRTGEHLQMLVIQLGMELRISYTSGVVTFTRRTYKVPYLFAVFFIKTLNHCDFQSKSNICMLRVKF